MRPSTQTIMARCVWLMGVCILSGLVMLAAMTGPAYAREPIERPRAQLIAPPAWPYPAGCTNGTQASGALYQICMPPGFITWNQDLLIFAHGYMPPTTTLRIPVEQLKLPDGTSIPDVINLLGYAFATTSYSTNGLAVPEGIADVTDLVAIFRQAHPTLRHVYLVGASEGGLITTLAIERRPDVFAGGLATCGPIGDFARHVNYLGDFRVVFDYFFPGLIPGSAITIPQSLIDTWDSSYYSTMVLPVLMNPASAVSLTQLLSVTMPAAGLIDAATAITTVKGVLDYSIFATNDGTAKLGGQPFDNWTRVYSGSLDDNALNAGVARFHADPIALQTIQTRYQPVGQLRAPLVTLHTTLDPIVPYWHEPLYRDRVVAHGRMPRYDEAPPGARYGHCNFTLSDVQTALALLVSRVANPPSIDVDLSDGDSRTVDQLSTVIFTHTLTNAGNLSGTFTIEAASADHWPVALLNGNQPTETLSVFLEAGLTATLRVSVSVPSATQGAVDSIVLTATSQISPSIFIAVDDEVRVGWRMYLPVAVR
jgi:pimeloyl-ACP methyl ester carboxylesterase